MSYCRECLTGHYVYPTVGGVVFDDVFIDNMFLDVLVYLLATQTINKSKSFETDLFQSFLKEGKILFDDDGDDRITTDDVQYHELVSMEFVTQSKDETNEEPVYKLIDLDITITGKTVTFVSDDDKAIILSDAFKIFLFVLSGRPEELLRRYHHGLTMVNENRFYQEIIFSF